MKTRLFRFVSLMFALSLIPCAPLVRAQQTTDEGIRKKEAELKQQQLDLQKKDLELQRRELDLEKAKQELQYQENGQSLSMNLSGDVLFDYDKATLKPQAEDALKKVAVVLSQFPESMVTVEGFTDAKGSTAFNLTLSRDRATTVKDWLVKTAASTGRRLARTERVKPIPSPKTRILMAAITRSAGPRIGASPSFSPSPRPRPHPDELG